MPDSELKRIFISFLKLFIWLFLLWVIFYSIYVVLPYTRPGADIVFKAKIDAAENDLTFPSNAEYRVLIFGDSKVLAAFIPHVFDSLNNSPVYSFNLGLPNTTYFLPVLKNFIQRDNIPTHVFLTADLDNSDEQSRTGVIEYFFPFRLLPRNMVTFFVRSFTRGGPAAFYQFGKESVTHMIDNRGYFFIEGQSQFPNHRLPADFRLSTDTPDNIMTRTIQAESPVFKELLELGEQYDIHFYFVPNYYRINQYAPPIKENNTLIAKLEEYHHFHVLGPDYLLFENNYFSDVDHLNPEGAILYTRKLRELFEKYLKG